MPLPLKALGDYQKFYRHVLVDDVEDVKVITIRRPEALNALHDELTDEILDILRTFEAGCGCFRICVDRLRDARVLRRRRHRSVSADARKRGGRGAICTRLFAPACSSRPYAKAGCRRTQRHDSRWRSRTRVSLPWHRRMSSAWLQYPEITLGIVPGIGAMVVPYRRWPAAAAVFHGMLRRAEKLSTSSARELGIVDALANDYAGLIEAAIARVRSIDRERCGHLPMVQLILRRSIRSSRSQRMASASARKSG